MAVLSCKLRKFVNLQKIVLISPVRILCFLIFVLLLSNCGAETPASPAELSAPTATQTPTATVIPPTATFVNGTPPTATPIPIRPTNTPQPTPTIDAVSPLSHTVNILLLGSDRRPEARIWRTDVIMLIALDMERGRAGVISLPRDIYIDNVPGVYPSKINTIDLIGEQDGQNEGPKLLASVLQAKTGIRIDHFVRFEFESFKQVVDILGGVDVEVDCAYYDTIADQGVTLNLKPGIYHFDGKEAISYARSRSMGGDLDRNRRQQQVIWAIRNRIKETNFITKIPALYSTLANSVATDISLLEMVRLARFGVEVEPNDIHGMVVQEPLLVQSWRQQMFVFIADWPAISKAAQDIFAKPAFEEAVKVGPQGERLSCPY